MGKKVKEKKSEIESVKGGPEKFELPSGYSRPADLEQLCSFMAVIDNDDPSGLEYLSSLIKELNNSGDEMLTSLLSAAADKALETASARNEKSRSEAYSAACRLIDSAVNYQQINAAVKTSSELKKPAEIKISVPESEFQFNFESVDRETLSEFLNDCEDNIGLVEESLLALEGSPGDAEEINNVFRAVHTLKGSSGILNLTFISQLAHRAESLLSKIRDRELEYNGWHADLALWSIDMLKELVCGVKDRFVEKPRKYDELLNLLTDAEAGRARPLTSSFMMPAQGPRVGDILVMNQKVSRETVEKLAHDGGSGAIGINCVKSGGVSVSDVAHALRTQKAVHDDEDSTLRVRVSRVDKLINMVGELVIAQSMVMQDELVKSGTYYAFSKKVSQAGKIVRELQDLSLTMRMIHFKATFQKIARLVRDLSAKNGKLVEFVALGKDTEVDRNLVELINDALVHMIRNSLDHGIEKPDEREAAKKPRKGNITLSAYNMSGNIVVEIEDDGRGLDKTRILKKAIEKGIIKTGDGMSDDDIFNLIFLPGFSTAETVTDISGRGVGMDVVKNSIAALKGKIFIKSIPGFGCTFTIKIPLTMAITDGMLVRAGNHRYIIPTVNIQMSFRPVPDAISTISGRGEMVMLRKKMLPIVRLHKIFGIEKAIEDPCQALLMVIEDGSFHYALLVDELMGQHQLVSKSLHGSIGKVPGISGGAILGDGRVGLIIDTAAIAKFHEHDGNL